MDWQSSFLTLPSVHTKSDKWLLSSRWEKAQRMKIWSLYVLRTEVPVFYCWNRKHCQILLEDSIVTLANTTFAQGENGRGHLSATRSLKKLEMKDTKEITALHGLLQRCLVLSVFVRFLGLFSLIFGCHRGRCNIGLIFHSWSEHFSSNSASNFSTRKNLDFSSLLQEPHDSWLWFPTCV